ncbi:MAG: peptide synthase [Deltaproteobacteria bacterium]|nr:MAG: peptide synthase [Deltaproteobacteria bacterium]
MKPKETANIAQAFVDTARDLGEKIAVVEAVTGRTASFAALNQLADGYARLFEQRGVRPGDRVMLMVTPSVDFIALTFGLFKVGVTLILIDPGMGYKNLLRCIENVRPDVFVGIPKAYLFTKIFQRPFRTVRLRFCCGNSWGLFGRDIRKAAQATGPSFSVFQPGEDDLAAIIFTTGSTGPPKGVRYEHSIFAAQLERIRTFYNIDENHIDQPAFPLFGLFSVALGAMIVIPDMDPSRPALVDPVRFVKSISDYEVTYSFGSPAIWNVVSRYCEQQGLVLQTVKKVLMAGAPVPGELLERTRNILPDDAEIFTPYGATESLPIVSIESRELLGETLSDSEQGRGICVGRPLPGISVRVIDIVEGPIADIGQATNVACGEIGEIIVRGNVVTRAYENNAEETALAKIADGSGFWHRIGDTGYLDEQNRLWFCGRKAHRVAAREGMMYTIPCEAIINKHPEVFRSALVGIPIVGADCEEPVLVIEPISGFQGNEQDLIAEVQNIARQHTLTASIQHFLIHHDFPVDIRHNAKIFREKLAVWAEEKLQVNQ